MKKNLDIINQEKINENQARFNNLSDYKLLYKINKPNQFEFEL